MLAPRSELTKRPEVPASGEELALAEERLRAYRADPTAVQPWAAVRARIRGA